MKRSSKIILGVVVALGLAGAVTAKQFCQHGPGGHGPWKHSQKMVNHLSEELELNDTQHDALTQLKDEMMQGFKTMRPMRPDEGMIKGLLGAKFDQAGALALVNERTQKVEQTAPQMIQSVASFYDSLNPEQQAKVSELVEHRLSARGRHGRRHGRYGEDSNDDRDGTQE